jgi:hypothetical protein
MVPYALGRARACFVGVSVVPYYWGYTTILLPLRSPDTGVDTHEIRPSGQTATPSPLSSLVTLFAIPFTMKTPSI